MLKFNLTQLTINSIMHAVELLAQGYILKHKNGNSYYKLTSNAELRCYTVKFNDNKWHAVSGAYLSDICKSCDTEVYTESPDSNIPWYETTPKKGILCEANLDDNVNRRDIFTIIIAHDASDPIFPFINNAGRGFREATPAKLSYLKKFMYE